MHMGIEKKVYSFRLDEELAERLKVQAAAENRNLSNLIETVLKEYLKKKEKDK